MGVPAGIPFVIINSLCGALCAYGLAGLRMQAHAVLINLCVVALQSMISIQLQARAPCSACRTTRLLAHISASLAAPGAPR
jgi:hypothetical protein